jgi:CubicO group peptidase (beta-lactamase class C family)
MQQTNRKRYFLPIRVFLLFALLLGACSLQGASPPFSPREDPAATPTDIPSSLKAVLDPLRLPTTTPTIWLPATEALPAPPDPTTPPDLAGELPDLAATNPALALSLQRLLDDTSTGPYTPGLVMHIAIPGQGQWTGASGLSDRVAQTPMQPGDRFRIASVTKMYVATVVLQLVQEGTLTLDDTVERWLPGLVPNGQAITLRHLLSHTSGLYDYLDGGFEAQYFAHNPPRVWHPSELVRYGVSHQPYFAPGEPGRWKYSNTNYIILGMIIERVTGTSLTHQLRSRIFNPLELSNTFLEDYEEIAGGFVCGYILNDDYSYASLSVWAAGGIVSTASDVATFVRALFGGRLLSQDMLNEMLTFADMSGYPLYGLGVAKNVEAFAVATQGVMPQGTRYPQVWGHTGGLSGFKSVVGYLPTSGITIVVLMNQMWVPILPIALDGLDLATGRAAGIESN